MPPEAASRVQRLIRWIKANRTDLLSPTDGDVSPSQLALATGKKPSYWSDVLRYEASNKSFGDKVARDTESALSMPSMHLEGIGWPFESVDQARFDRLTARQQGRIERAMLDELERIEAEQAARLGEPGTPAGRRSPPHARSA